MIKKNHSYRSLIRKKISFSFGNEVVFLDVDDLIAYLGISKSYAYKLMRSPDGLNDRQKLLIRLQRWGAMAGFSPGWYVSNGLITAPDGYTFNQIDLENLMLLKRSGLLNEKPAMYAG